MEEWLPFLFGLLQGVTEFLPISSSGHFFLLENFLGLKQDSLSFVIILHGATVLSVITIFFKDLKKFATNLTTKASDNLLLKVLVSSIPLGVVGLFFRNFVEQSFQEIFVGLGFLTTSLLLLSLFFKKNFSTKGLSHLSFSKAFLVGIFQAVAVFPGFSRSGWTVSTGLLLGLSPRASVYYSFLISLPAILGSVLVEVILNFHSFVFSFDLFLSFLTAYVSGTCSLYFVLKIVQKNRFFLFGLYLLPLSFYLILF